MGGNNYRMFLPRCLLYYCHHPLRCQALWVFFLCSICLSSHAQSVSPEALATAALKSLRSHQKVSQLILNPAQGQVGGVLPFSVVYDAPPAYLSTAEWQNVLNTYATDSSYLAQLALEQARRYQPQAFVLGDSSLHYPVAYLAALEQLNRPLLLLDSTKTHTLDFPLSLSKDYKSSYKILKKQYKSKSALNTACLRVLTYKYRSLLADSLLRLDASGAVDIGAYRGYQRFLFFKGALSLLKNRNQALPLATKQAMPAALAWVRQPQAGLSSFGNRLMDYAEVRPLELSSALSKQLANDQLVIFTFSKPPNAAQLTHLQQIDKGTQQWIALSFHPLGSIDYTRLPFDACLFVPSIDSIAQDISVQALFGAIGISTHRLAAKPTIGLAAKGDILSFVPPQHLGVDSTTLHDLVRHIIDDAIQAQAFPGCQILVAKDNQVFFYETYGHHTYDSMQVVRRRDLYDLASITKVMAPISALMYWYDKKRFHPDDLIQRHIPRWKRAANSSFRDVLAHQAGLKSWIPYYKDLYKKTGRFKRAYISKRLSSRYPTTLSKGMYLRKNFHKVIYKKIYKSEIVPSGYQYSDLMFYFFPRLIERLANTSYERFVYDQFYNQMGATTLRFNPYRYFSLSRIVPTERDNYFRQRLLHGVVHDEGAALMGGISGHAGLFGKAIDVAKMWSMYLNNGTYAGVRYLSKESIALFTACAFCEQGNRRGLGFDKPPIIFEENKSTVAQAASAHSFGHSGFTGTLAWADPVNGLIFIFLSNRVYPSREQRAIYEKNVRPRLHQALYNFFEK